MNSRASLRAGLATGLFCELFCGLFWTPGCADPKLIPFRDAATAYDAGRKALDAGDADAAIVRFAEARTLDPQSATLPLWQGRAFAAAGRLDEAVSAADDAIALHPDDGIAHYNRAAWRARQGRLNEAAAGLQMALTLKAATVWQAARDPDFQPHRASPAFAAVLPQQDLLAKLEGPGTTSFLGSELVLTFTFVGPDDQVPVLIGPAVPACLRQRRIVEDDHLQEGTARRELRVYFTAMAACVATVGPFEARGSQSPSDPTRVIIPAQTVTVLGIEATGDGGATAQPLPVAWIFPSAVSGSAPVPGWDGATATMGTRPAASQVLLEWRVDEQTRSVGGITR